MPTPDNLEAAKADPNAFQSTEELKQKLDTEQRAKVERTLAQAGAAPKGDEKGIGTSPSQTEHIMQFFAYEHLPPPLQVISKPFGVLADVIVTTTPRNPERTVALRKLLESKDAAVRAFIAK